MSEPIVSSKTIEHTMLHLVQQHQHLECTSCKYFQDDDVCEKRCMFPYTISDFPEGNLLRKYDNIKAQ